MNRWLDEHPENAHIRSPEQMLDGRINEYHPHTDKSDERYMGDGIAERLTGTHGRADVNVMTTSWEDAPSPRRSMSWTMSFAPRARGMGL